MCSCESDFLPDTEPLPVNDRSSDVCLPRPGDFSYGLKFWSLSEELMRVNGVLGLILLPDWECECIPWGRGVRSSTSSSTREGKAVDRTGVLIHGLCGGESKSLTLIEPRKRTRSLAIYKYIQCKLVSIVTTGEIRIPKCFPMFHLVFVIS
jgi:hypothetical protein